MGRNINADTKPLLLDAEQNIGNSNTIIPLNPASPASGTSVTVIPQTNPPRLISLTGGSAAGQTTSVVVTASRINGQENPYPGYAGPVTGIVEFGNGGRFTRAEFDVPVGGYAGFFTQSSAAVEPQDGGTIITVPSGVIRIYARYDNLLLAPLLNSDPPICLAQLAGRPLWGPGGPRATAPLPAQPDPILAEPLLVKAMSAYFTRPRARVYKTLYLYTSNLFLPATAPVTGPNTPYAYYCLPAFTKTIKVLREPLTTTLDIVLRDGVQTIDQYRIAAGTSAPEIEVSGQATIIGIQSLNLIADQVSFLAISCEIGI